MNKSIVFLRSNPVDPDSRVEKEVNSLVKFGYDVKVLGWDRSYKYKIKESYLSLDAGKVKIYRFGIPAIYGGGIKNNLIPMGVFQLRLLKWLFKNKNCYDIIHACDFDTAFVASYCAKLLNKKLVYDIFDYYVDAFRVPRRLKNIVERKDHDIIDFADAVIICTEKRKEQIIGTNPKKLIVIHNTPPSINREIQILNLNKKKVKIVYVGVLDNSRFIKEIAEITIENENYEFHIGGIGTEESYFKELAKTNERIHFYGKLPYNKTLELENSCDIITAIYDPAIHNHYYAAPNKFYEGLMLRKPLVVVKHTGIDEIVVNNNIGEVIDYSIESLRIAIEKLVLRRSEWPEMAERMKYIYEKSYSWIEMEKRLLKLYETI